MSTRHVDRWKMRRGATRMWSHRWEVAPRDVGVVGSVYIGMTGMLSHYWRHSCRAGSITPAVVCTICSRALSSLFYLAELSCQPEGHGHLAASCLSTYLHAHTRTERVMVLIEERPSLPPNRACLRCNRTHTHAPVKSRPAASASRQLFSQARPAAPCWQQWKGGQQHQQQAPTLLPAGRLSHRSRHLLPSIFA